jgi:hypothetical protein
MKFWQLLSHIFVNLEFKRAQKHKTNSAFYNCVQEYIFCIHLLLWVLCFRVWCPKCSPRKVKTIVPYSALQAKGHQAESKKRKWLVPIYVFTEMKLL